MTIVDVALIVLASGVAALAVALGVVAAWRMMRTDPDAPLRLTRFR
jgi:ABC-type Fe3+ transport system permease subunit